MAKKDRRHFLGSMAAMVAVVAASKAGLANAITSFAPGIPSPKNALNKAVIGIQMSPHTMLDEGIEHCLDLIKSTAEVNAVFPYSHAFHTSTLGKPLRDLATNANNGRARVCKPGFVQRNCSACPQAQYESVCTNPGKFRWFNFKLQYCKNN